MSFMFLQEKKEACGLHNMFNTRVIPFDIGDISLLEDGDGLPIIDKFSFLSLHITVELFRSGIIHADDLAKVVINSDNVYSAADKHSLQIRCPVWPNWIIFTFTMWSLECGWHFPKWFGYVLSTEGQTMDHIIFSVFKYFF